MKREDIHIQIPRKAASILDKLHKEGYEAYVVGGCVRDSILGRDPQDWDITTNALPEQVKALFRRTVDTGIKHGTVTVMDGKEGFEVTTYRLDGVYEDHRHPDSVTFTRNLTEDLKRRDFTINAMAYNDEEGLVDEFEGLEDIDRKVIRCVGDPFKRFDEDALRILRALRFSAQLGYSIDDDTARACRELADTLNRISAERIQTEFVKLVTSPHPEALIKAYELGITAVFLPEFDRCMDCPQNNPHHAYSVGEHSIRAAMNVSEDKVLRLTMVFHDMGKPQVRTTDEKGIDHFLGHAVVSGTIARDIMKRLKFDNVTMDRVCNLVSNHDIFLAKTPTEKRVRFALNTVGPENFEDLLMVIRADNMAKSAYKINDKLRFLDKITELYHKIIERGDCLSLKELAVSGQDLIAAGIAPGRMLGATLNNMLKDVLESPSHNTKEYLMGHLEGYNRIP